ncbi:heme exporter protein CcmD [Rhizorhapis sp. SPR117]|nr:heme exporter protein CcmD [Rhizorhapis sp. SPR117]
MNHWPYIIAAYALTFAGTAGLCVWAYVSMRRAERRAAELTRER